MRIWIDPYKCDGYGACFGSAPDLLEFDDDTNQAYALDEEVPAGMESKARAAARSCPVKAVVVAD